MLTHAQSHFFLVNTLKFKRWKVILDQDKFLFLRMLVAYYSHHLYFQNVTITSSPQTEQEIVKAGLIGIGGTCLVQNVFLNMLLKALDFKSYLVPGFIRGGPKSSQWETNHVICIVELNSGEKYLLDLGVALPFAEPVPLHKLPYTKTAAGFRYRYKEAGEDHPGLFYRVQLDGALFAGEFDDLGAEYIRYEFTLEPKLTKIIFNDILDHSPFLQSPIILFRYFMEDEQTKELRDDQPEIFGDRKWILVRGMSVLIGTDNNREVTHYSNYDEVKEVILKYFPKLMEDDVERAIQNYKRNYRRNSCY